MEGTAIGPTSTGTTTDAPEKELGPGPAGQAFGKLGNQDNWKHRSQGMKCNTCMWYVSKHNSRLTTTETKPFIGRCRRHAPTMNGYPVVFELDWCGDHKLDEEKT